MQPAHIPLLATKEKPISVYFVCKRQSGDGGQSIVSTKGNTRITVVPVHHYDKTAMLSIRIEGDPRQWEVRSKTDDFDNDLEVLEKPIAVGRMLRVPLGGSVLIAPADTDDEDDDWLVVTVKEVSRNGYTLSIGGEDWERNRGEVQSQRDQRVARV